MPVPNPANHPHFAASCAADSVAQAAAHSQTSACLPARAPAVCIMVLGCTSGAGKSWLATALCRWYANQGLRVAPFKAQNMSNNARVVPAPASSVCGAGSAGAEIGAAQYFQALAARVQPDVRMNPLLLKPESDTRSQVVLLGQVNPTLTALPWRERSSHVWPHITAALDALRAENDVVVIEGAGSPAEINLAASDVVNMRVARYCNAACMLVADIDRGGAFAHLYGTWAMLPHEADRQLLRGFVLNKFRGNASLLAPAPALLQQRTGLPVLATLPMWHNHGLPEEDSLFTATPPAAPQPHAASTPSPANANADADANTSAEVGADAATATNASSTNTTPAAPSITIAIIAYPRSSNLDEFAPLASAPHVRLLWVREAAQKQQLQDLQPQDWIILPGSKATIADLHWLRAQGLDAAICTHAAQGGRVLGICGGLQILGHTISDPHGSETAPTPAHATTPTPTPVQGLNLLPLHTTLGGDKTICHTTSRFAAPLHGAWAALAGVPVQGYEIHTGQTSHIANINNNSSNASTDTTPHATPAAAQALLHNAAAQPLGWLDASGNVLGLYLHGLFEDSQFTQALLGSTAPTLDETFNRMADFIGQHFGANTLHTLLSSATPSE